MIAFVRHNLKTLCTPSYIFVAATYYCFAWLTASPMLSPDVIHSSNKLTGTYDAVLMSIVFLNFLYFVAGNFRIELQEGKRTVLAFRMSHRELFWRTVIGYFLFFFIGFVLVAYLTAFMQQLWFAPAKVRPMVFLAKTLCHITGYSTFWIVAAVWLVLKTRNEFVVLMILLLGYGASQLVNVLTQGVLFNEFWIIDSTQPLVSFVFWLIIIFATYLIGSKAAEALPEADLTEPYREGIFAGLARKLKADLSMHHLTMMGLAGQKVLMTFSFLGLLFVAGIAARKDANLLPLAKLYLGAFVPCLISLNQFFLIRIDRDAGMVHNNILRRLSYSRIILNRWLLLLVVQILTTLFFAIVLSVLVQPLPIGLVLYLLLLGAFCSAFNLFFSVATQSNGVANMALLFFVYTQLRDDVQTFVVGTEPFRSLNIFSVLVSQDHLIALGHWSSVTLGIILLLFMTTNRIRHLAYVR